MGRTLRAATLLFATCVAAACDSGGGTGASAGGAAIPATGGAGATGTGGTLGGTPAAGTGAMTGGTTGTAGVVSTGGTSAGGTGGAGGSAGAGSDAGTAGTGGTGADGGSGCDLACDPGTHCELIVVQCFAPPCPPLEECVDDPSCGGFAGLPCPGAGECADDPRDSCDPMNGGADCGGLCACADSGSCPLGQTWNSSPAVCACTSAKMTPGDGEACGKTTCDKGMVCCNASCGICAPPDGACIQIACR